MTRGLRNNNPGNIRYNPHVRWQGEVPVAAKQDRSFAEFTNIEYGYRALLKLLKNYRTLQGLRTIEEMISRWAPPSENDTEAYINAVCRDMNVTRRFLPDVNNRETMVAFAAAISKVENGVPANMPSVYAGWNRL